MKEYCIKANQFTSNRDIIISRDEVIDIKNKIKVGGNTAYSVMLNTMSPKVAITRAIIFPGTKLLVWCLNALIVIGRLLIIALIISAFYQKWLITLLIGILFYIITFILQTHLNYEIGARLFALDKYLDIQNITK